MNQKKGKMLHISCIKIFAVLLVAYGHFIPSGTWATDFYGIISGTMAEPLLPSMTQQIWKLEAILTQTFNVQLAIVGVVLFFLVSGYFIPDLQRRFNGKYLREGSNFPSLVLVRAFRLYPMMFLCVIVNGILVYLSQGIQFPISDYIGTALLINGITQIQTTMPVAWYLWVLLFVYMICTVVPKLTVTNLTKIYLFLFGCVISPHILGDSPVTWIAWKLEYLARYAGILFLGSYVALSENFTSKLYRVIGFAWYFILTLALPIVDEALYQLPTTYSEINTYWAAFIIIGVFYALCYFIKDSINEKIVNIIYFIEKNSLAFYLIHVHFGITTMFFLKQAGVNSYVNLSLACAISAIVAVIITKLAGNIERMTWYKTIGDKLIG